MIPPLDSRTVRVCRTMLVLRGMAADEILLVLVYLRCQELADPFTRSPPVGGFWLRRLLAQICRRAIGGAASEKSTRAGAGSSALTAVLTGADDHHSGFGCSQ